MKDRTGTIYAVLSDSGECRYIGATIRKLSQREREHNHSAETGSQTPIARFVRKNGPITLVPVILGVPRADLGVYEKSVMDLYRSVGEADLNVLRGGYHSDDYFEYRKSSQQRTKQSEISRANWSDVEWAENQRILISRATQTPEYRAEARERLVNRLAQSPWGPRKSEDNPQAKLTSERVMLIRERYAGGAVTYNDLAVEYGVTESCIHRVVKRKSWKNV